MAEQSSISYAALYSKAKADGMKVNGAMTIDEFNKGLSDAANGLGLTESSVKQSVVLDLTVAKYSAKRLIGDTIVFYGIDGDPLQVSAIAVYTYFFPGGQEIKLKQVAMHLRDDIVTATSHLVSANSIQVSDAIANLRAYFGDSYVNNLADAKVIRNAQKKLEVATEMSRFEESL